MGKSLDISNSKKNQSYLFNTAYLIQVTKKAYIE